MSVQDAQTTSYEDELADFHLEWQVRTLSDERRSSYFRWKAIADRILAGLLLVPGLPIIGALVLLVRVTSRGPGLYRQIRVGKDGRLYMMYKIRTMRHDAEAEKGAMWSTAGDSRVTAVGRVLRKLHLDEFPQLFNVITGEMSLIGPRPERPEFVHILRQEIPGYHERLTVRPGITGLAQLNLPPDSDLDSVLRKVALDSEYIETATVWLDLRIFICTFGRLMKIREGLLLRILGLRREVDLHASGPAQPQGGNGRPNAPVTPAEIVGKTDGQYERRKDGLPRGETAGSSRKAK